MRIAGIVVIVAACQATSWRDTEVSYRAPKAPSGWIRIDPGSYAFLWTPSTEPALVKQDPAVHASPQPSTLAELVVSPGSEVSFTLPLPHELAVAGCVLDSVSIAHGGSGDLELEVRSADKVLETRRYAKMPDAGANSVVVRDYPVQAPVPPATTAAPPPKETVDIAVRIGGWTAGARIAIDAKAEEPTISRIEAPPTPSFMAVVHPMRVPVDGAITIVLRARTQPFGIAVRSDSESKSPPLSYREPDGTGARRTHLVPQAAVLLTRCRRAANTVLHDDIGQHGAVPDPQE